MLLPTAVILVAATATSTASASACHVLDDFNRPDSTSFGPNWTEQTSDWGLSGGEAGNPGGSGVMTYNGSPLTSGLCADVRAATIGTVYAGFVVRRSGPSDSMFVKVQNNSGGDSTFDRVYFYRGDNGSGGSSGNFAIATPFSAARISLTVVGQTATLEIDRDFDGTADETLSSTYGSGVGSGTDYGIVSYNNGKVDNFGVTGAPPVVTADAGPLAYTEQQTTAISPGLTVTDADSTMLTGADVRISAGRQTGDDLAFTDQNGITGAYDAPTGVLSLTGSATVGQYEAALRSVTFHEASDAPTASRTIEFRADDGAGPSTPASRTIAVTAVDDAPVAAGDSATVTEDDPATAVDVLANDTDVDGGPMGVASVTRPPHGTVSITGGGTGLTYTPDANACGPDAFTYTLNGGSSASVGMTVTCTPVTPPAATSTAPAPAKPQLNPLTFAWSPQLLLERRAVSMRVGCGPVACRMRITGTLEIDGAASRRLRPAGGLLAVNERRRLQMTFSSADRRAIRRAGRGAQVQLRFDITGADGTVLHRAATVKLRRRTVAGS